MGSYEKTKGLYGRQRRAGSELGMASPEFLNLFTEHGGSFMKRRYNVFICSLLLIILNGCSTTCKRTVEYQATIKELEGIKIPIEIRGVKIPIEIAKYKNNKELLRQASESIQILDNRQYGNCQLLQQLPPEQRKELVAKIIDDNKVLDQLALILQSPSDQMTEQLIKWIKDSK